MGGVDSLNPIERVRMGDTVLPHSGNNLGGEPHNLPLSDKNGGSNVGFDKGRPSAAAGSRDRRDDAHSGSGGGEGSQRAIHSAGSVNGEAGRGRATLAPVDLICGGFPCQDLSTAGRRAGLAGSRSGLWWEFHRIIGEIAPRWVLIENVPGLLSSNKGQDMAVVLQGLEELGYGWSYRILDSQHFGVPQRRRRVFIVGCLGAPCPPEILLEPESLCRDPETFCQEGEEATRSVDGGPGKSRSELAYWDGGEISDTLDVSTLVKGQMMPEKRRFPVVMKCTGFSDYSSAASDEAASTLRVKNHESTDLVLKATGFGKYTESSHCGPLRAKGQQSADVDLVLSAAPRRLTPRECERLQGFPDDWTLYKDDGTELADTPRYRMMGNAVTVNVAEWLGRHLAD